MKISAYLSLLPADERAYFRAHIVRAFQADRAFWRTKHYPLSLETRDACRRGVGYMLAGLVTAREDGPYKDLENAHRFATHVGYCLARARRIPRGHVPRSNGEG